MATKSLRIDEALILQAQRHSKVEHRSINSQIEYWAKLGKAIASKISTADAFAVTQGIKEIRLEVPAQNLVINPDNVLRELEFDRKKGFADKPVTSAPYYFEASISKPGLLDRVNTRTGEREAGMFQNGQFEVA